MRSKKNNGWKYRGDRADCQFAVNGRTCYRDQQAACAAAKCATACTTRGAGPTLVECAVPTAPSNVDAKD